jgi:hypothetical protein
MEISKAWANFMEKRRKWNCDRSRLSGVFSRRAWQRTSATKKIKNKKNESAPD